MSKSFGLFDDLMGDISIYIPLKNVDPKTHVIYGNVPSKSNSYRIITFKGKNGKNHASIGKTSVLKRYEKDFYKQYVRKRPCIEGEFKIELKIYYPSRRADLDGCLKVILDCLQKVGAVKNDNKCVGILADRFVDKLNPRVEFILIEIH